MRHHASILAAIAAIGLTACEGHHNETNEIVDAQTSATQQAILKEYVGTVVVPTYRALADAAIRLADDCTDLSSQARVDQACNDWKTARREWELSEAFLFGAASDYSIDPHIDSWPLDLTQLDEVLKSGDIERRIENGTAGYGLLGFHAVEYVIFREGSTGEASDRNRPYSTITADEATYAAAVAADMRDQCIRLEASWAGMENISAQKQALLAEAELEPTMNYGDLLVSAGLEGNAKYKTQAAAMEEIVVGASDIANEVGNAKISDPYNSHQWSDVESPHSWNSVTDFTDNILSVRNAYYGTLDGTVAEHSLAAFLARIDPAADTAVRNQLKATLEAIHALPTPFRSYIATDTDPAIKARIEAAIDACNDLVSALDQAQEAVTK